MNEIRIFMMTDITQLCFRNSSQYDNPPKINSEDGEIILTCKWYDWLPKKIGQGNENIYKN